MTPLFAACQYGYYKVIRHLLQHPKVEVNKCAYAYYATPLYMAAVGVI